jgi:hypothetical protein
MSNTHGHLPKAERAQLPAELHQRLAVWTTKAYTDEALVGFQGLILTWAPETRNAFVRLLKNKSLKEDSGHTNRVVRHGFIPTATLYLTNGVSFW